MLAKCCGHFDFHLSIVHSPETLPSYGVGRHGGRQKRILETLGRSCGEFVFGAGRAREQMPFNVA